MPGIFFRPQASAVCLVFAPRILCDAVIVRTPVIHAATRDKPVTTEQPACD